MFKRSLSLLLCLVLMFSAVPWSALAVEGSPVKTITLPESPETDAVTEPVVSQTPVSTKSPTPQSDFVFVEPGKENDSPVGDVIITDQAYRVQMNPDMQSYTIVEYFGSEKNVVIPSTYNGLPITRIGSYAFLNRTAVQTVRIPESVARMETDVFAGCKALQYNEYNGGKYLGSENNAYYYYCGPVEAQKATVTEATMHPDTKLIAAFAFRDCENLRSVVVPDGVKQVGYGMVFGCELESITLPFVGELGTQKNPQFGWIFGARSIGGNISYVPMSLKTVVITGGADGKQGRIAQGAFYGVDMIEEITLPFLGGSADNRSKAFISYYWGADSYTQNILPVSVKHVEIKNDEVEKYAFYNCGSLQTVAIYSESAYSYIDRNAFYGCTSLQSVILPNGLYEIGDNAFYNCSSLTSITIPTGVRIIGYSVFYNCSSLTSIAIPEGVTTIGGRTFYGCSSLTSIALPKGVTNIEYQTFYGCSSLASIEILGDATYIASEAFYNCSSLTSITIPEGVTSIGENAFWYCTSLQSVTIPGSVTSIGNYAFAGCDSLEEVHITDLAAWCGISFSFTDSNPLSYAKNLYLNGEPAANLEIPEGVTSIGQYAFYNCLSLQSITIPEGVTSIGKDAFWACKNLTSITIPGSVTAIGNYAFANCSGLEKINITDIAAWCNISFGNEDSNPLRGGRDLYLNGKLLTHLVIPEGVTTIGQYAFYECLSLLSVTIPEGVTSIGDYAFFGCSGMTNVSIPYSVTTIGSNAFRNCTILYKVTNNSNLPFTPGNTGYGYVAYYARVLINKDGSVSGNSSYVETADGFLFQKSSYYTLIAYVGDKETVTLPLKMEGKTYQMSSFRGASHVIIPEGMTSIGRGAFRYCRGLQSVSIPASVTTIGDEAFSDCINLRSITIPQRVTTIGNSVFYGCSNLQSVVISEGVKTINYGAFYNCSNLESITIPSSITSIGNEAFYGCHNLQNVYITDLAAWCKISFGSNGYANPLHFARNLYVNGVCVREITVPETVTALKDSVFYAPYALDKITLTKNVKSLETNSIHQNIKIDIVANNSYMQVIDGVLYDKPATQILSAANCAETVRIPNGVTFIDRAFTGKTNLRSITIPEGVKNIQYDAFYGCSNLESVTIPSSLTNIDENVFYGCDNLRNVYITDLTAWCNISFYGAYSNPLFYASNLYVNGVRVREITVPETVTEIKSYTFYTLSALSKVTLTSNVKSYVTQNSFYKGTAIAVVANNPYMQVIDGVVYDKPATKILSAANCAETVRIPNTVTVIGNSAFSGCKNLKNVIIPAGVTTIGDYAFSGCNNLTAVTLPSTVTTLGKRVFYNCSSLQSVTIPNSVTTLGDYMFYNCSSLQNITIPNSVTTIGTYAFYNCSSLQNITIPNSVTTLGIYAFYNCSSLQNVTIPGSVTTIGGYTFYNCSSLQNVTIPNSVTTIGTYAFYNCSNLQNITIPNSVTLIDKYAFTNSGLQNVYITDLAAWCNITFNNNPLYYAKNFYVNGKLVTDLVIPQGVTSISKYAFEKYSALRSVTIPGSVTSIGPYAFSGCSNLQQVTLSEGVTTIGNYAFRNCISLQRITFPNSITTIGNYAFEACSSLLIVTLSGNLTTINDYAFDECNKLYKVINNSSLPVTIGSSGNGRVAYYAKILVNKDGSVSTATNYVETADGFLVNKTRNPYTVVAYLGDQETTTLPLTVEGNAYALSNFHGAKNVIIPEGITAIDNTAFYGSSNLQSITIPDSVTTIGNSAFYGCSNLQSITIPDSVTTIGDNAFFGCSSLQTLRLPEAGFAIGDYAFADCIALKSVNLNNPEEVGSGIFSGCQALTQLQYANEENAWRHVMLASDWDSGMPELKLQFAEDTGILYETDEDRTEFYISGVDAKHKTVAPPAIYSGRPVVAVLSNTFNGNQTVEAITFPETVWYIGEKAFADCVELKDIQFPSGLTEMAHGVLSGCTALEELVLPFLGSTATDSENAYLAYTFGGYSYQDNAAYVPDGLATVTICQGTKIIDHAFEHCAKIQQINLPDSITEIGDYAFAGDAGLEQIPLPAELTAIRDYAFAGCASLAELKLPAQLGEIGDYGFQGCDSLKELILPDSVHTVGQMLLDGCNSLTTITIGAGLGYDGIKDTHNQANGNPFFGLDKSASRLSTYKVAAGNKDFIVTDNILYRKMDIDGKPVEVEVVDAPAKANLSSYQMPDSIVKIGAYAFAYNNTLRSIDLNYVRMVGNNAFYRAENMVYAQFGVPDMDITLPEGVNGICYNQFVGREAFAGCTALQRVNLDSPTLLGVEEGAFADCSSLATVNLGKNIQYIGIGAFGSSGSGVPALGAIHVDAANTHFESIDGVLYQKKADDTLTLLVYPPMSGTCEVKDGKRVFYVPEENVTGVESYAFRMAQNLDEIYLDPQQEMHIGDYAFANTMLERVYVGDNVVSLGLKRGEGEYTVFADCEYLVAVEVDGNNPYYSSQNGILFDKNATRLIKYPAAKAGNLYELPDTVRMIASMAFKNNDHLQNVRICSQVDTVGLEAFYSCSSLGMIFFDGVYAPASVLENAFTTYDSLNEESSANPRTLLGYSDGYYLDGENGEYGWSNYADVYNIALCESLPESEGRTGSNFYAVVVVDSNGNRLNNVHVTLTDPNGVSETVATGSNNASNGVAMFYNLFGSAGMGFSLVYDGTYSLEVADRFGEYFTYTNPSFYLDEDMRITYVTLTKLPSIYGTTCGETDINTESAEINKAEYGYTNVELIDASKGFVEGNYTTSSQSEYLDISVIAYCDTTSGWAFTDAQGNVLDLQTNGLYQNGIKICDVASVTVQDDSVVFHFRADVEKLSPEVQIEARLKAFNQESASFVCSTILNIHVFDFIVTEDDVNLDTQELEVDLAAEDETLAKLFGSSTLDVKLGENLNFGISVDGSRVEMTLGAEGSQSFGKSGVGSYASYEAGYDANHEPHNKNTYFFQFKDTFEDEKGVVHNLTYNVRFARGTEKSNYFYYRCYIYEGKYENEVAKYFGAVNGLNNEMAKVIGAKTYRERVAPKALLIYKTCSLMVNHEAKTVKDIKKVAESAAYIEGIANTPRYSNNHTFDMELSGKMVFEYDRENGLKPVSSEIHGELYYTFKHNSQFVVWVIPVVLEVEVKVGGEVDLKLKFDENWGVSLEEAKLTISAAISARVGVGCSVASVGIYGKIGMVLVLDFYPEFGVESFDLNGEIGAYVKVLWYTKDFPIAKFPKDKKMPTRAEMFLVKNYTSQDLDSCEGSARILSVGDQVYKIFYVNASNLEGYDAFNYRKLAIARWNGSDWDDAVILDPDCCRNDASYDLYFDGKQIHVVFTQQTEPLDESAMNDTYQASSNMAIKVATISDLENITVSIVHSGESYKYLPTMTQIGDELAVVWAENADNNMFGVSPYNYIDANGGSHVFETTANAVYISMLQADGWQVPMVVEDGLSAVTDIAAAEDGSVCFVVDQNGDLGDSEDRLLYNSDLQTVNAVNSLKNGSVTGVDADGDDYIYYLQSNNETVLSGFHWLYVDEIIPQVADFGENYRILRDDEGNVAAIFYIGLKTWQEGEKTVDGSAMYAVFCNSGIWGSPVEIGAFPAQKDVYISYFDVVYRSDSSVMVVADFVDKNGVLLHQLTDSDVSLEADLAVEDYEIDYINRILHITVVNQGAKPAQVFTAIDDGTRVSYPEAVASGNRQTISVPLAGCGNIEPDVFVYDSGSADAIYTIDDIDLNYADVVPMGKQLLLGEANNLLVGVKNTGVLTNSGYLIIRPGNYDAETIQAQNLLTAAQNGQTLLEGTVVAVNDKTYGQFWIVKITVEPGAVNHYEVKLTGFDKAEGLFSIYAYVDTDLEKGSALENNVTYLAYQQLTGVLSEGEEVTIAPKLQSNKVEFDIKTMETVSVDFTYGADNSVVSVSGLQQTDYQVTCENGKGTLTILKCAFSAPATYNLSVDFADGESCQLAVVVPRYYTITWMANGEELCTTEVKHGNMPYLPSNPVNADSQFVGWSVNASGLPLGIQVAEEDTTYYAVWGTKNQVYEITWVFTNEKGEQTTVKEQYAYNKVPEYRGKIPAPANKVFANWDKPISAVTENTTYTAVYKKAVIGSATISNTAFETAPGKGFTTTLQIVNVQDMEESVLKLTYNSDAVTLVDCVCRDNVTLAEQGENYLIFSLTLAPGQKNMELADLTFWADSSLEPGETQFLEVSSEDLYLPMWNHILIRDQGDLPGSGMVDQWNVSLDDDLRVNFYVKLSENVEKTAKIQITVGEETTIYRASELLKAVNGSYIASVRISAAQMTDYIMVVVMDGGRILGMSTYTVRAYADAILEEESFRQYHALVKEMLNYGGQAQSYFDYGTEELANAGITGVAAQEIPETTERVATKGTVNGVRFYGASLVYRDKIALRYYFNINGSVADYTFTANGKTYTPVLKDGLYYVEIGGILPQNLDQQITLTVQNGEEKQLSVTYGPMNYIVRMNEKGDDELKALLKALYNYHLAAKYLRVTSR